MIDLGNVIEAITPIKADEVFRSRLDRIDYRFRYVSYRLAKTHRGSPRGSPLYIDIIQSFETVGESDASFWLGWRRRGMWSL